MDYCIIFPSSARNYQVSILWYSLLQMHNRYSTRLASPSSSHDDWSHILQPQSLSVSSNHPFKFHEAQMSQSALIGHWPKILGLDVQYCLLYRTGLSCKSFRSNRLSRKHNFELQSTPHCRHHFFRVGRYAVLWWPCSLLQVGNPKTDHAHHNPLGNSSVSSFHLL